jgi:hypothetical protein
MLLQPSERWVQKIRRWRSVLPTDSVNDDCDCIAKFWRRSGDLGTTFNVSSRLRVKRDETRKPIPRRPRIDSQADVLITNDWIIERNGLGLRNRLQKINHQPGWVRASMPFAFTTLRCRHAASASSSAINIGGNRRGTPAFGDQPSRRNRAFISSCRQLLVCEARWAHFVEAYQTVLPDRNRVCSVRLETQGLPKVAIPFLPQWFEHTPASTAKR